MKKRILALLLVLALALAWLPIAPAQPVQAASTDIQDGVTLHCWNWSFANIEANMEKIASLGYTAIQTSPIQQAKQKTAGFSMGDWWVYYQPVAFVIDNTGNSALGTKAQFESMCDAAHRYGIKVIVDVVVNHMGQSGGINGSGLNGNIIPDLKNDPSCWHDINTNITNYHDRYNITQYCLSGLPDLNTANPKVQNYVLNFLKECVDAGADGFRFDAVKHVETPQDAYCASDFWPKIVNGIKAYDPDIYLYGELLYGPDDSGSLPVSAYTQYMSVTDNGWSNYVRNEVVGSGNAGNFYHYYHKDAPAKKLVLWAESHDTYTGEGSSNMSAADINKAWALAAARADAMALYLARPSNLYPQKLGTVSDTGWANPEVAAVNKFHNAFAGQSEYVSNEGGIAYVERGTSGVVLVDCSRSSSSVNVAAHTMADGTYRDQITGSTFTVSGGRIKGKIGSTGIAVVYNDTGCRHESHNANGICSSCGIYVGHDYDDGRCHCGAQEPESLVIYFRNAENWSKVNIYSWYAAGNEITNGWPGNAMEKVEGNLYTYALPFDAVNVIFNNGSQQTADLVIPEGKNLYDPATNTWSVYAPSEPEPTEPVPTDPEPTEPAPTRPAPTEPPATAPEPTEPTPTQPVTEPTDPAVTDPTEPESTEPTETETTETEITEATESEVTETEAPETEAAKSEDDEAVNAEEDSSALWLLLGCGAGVLILAGAVTVTILLVQKKKKK